MGAGVFFSAGAVTFRSCLMTKTCSSNEIRRSSERLRGLKYQVNIVKYPAFINFPLFALRLSFCHRLCDGMETPEDEREDAQAQQHLSTALDGVAFDHLHVHLHVLPFGRTVTVERMRGGERMERTYFLHQSSP